MKNNIFSEDLINSISKVSYSDVISKEITERIISTIAIIAYVHIEEDGVSSFTIASFDDFGDKWIDEDWSAALAHELNLSIEDDIELIEDIVDQVYARSDDVHGAWGRLCSYYIPNSRYYLWIDPKPRPIIPGF